MTIDKIAIVSRSQWLALRRLDITASDVPAVLGAGLYGSRASVYAEKMNLLAPIEMNAALQRGIWGEAAVFTALEETHPDWEIKRAKVYLRDAEARLGATPDGAAIVPDKFGVVIVQTKVIATPIFRNDWITDGSLDIQHAQATPPLAYRLQTLTEMMLAGASCGVLAVLVVDTFRWTLRTFWIERHEEAEASIRAGVAAFWRDFLDKGVVPPAEPEKDLALMKALYPQETGETIDLTHDNMIREMLEKREGAKKIIKEATERIDSYDTMLREKIGTAAIAVLPGWQVNLKTVNRKGYEVKPSSYRQLNVKRTAGF